MKKSRGLKVLGIVLVSLVLFFIVVNVIPPKQNVESNPFLVEKGELPMVAAHRGGAINNPENTLLAFREAVNTYGVDILESDLYLTADGYLVYNHDDYIDTTCNVNGELSYDEVDDLCDDRSKRHYIRDMTLEELRQYNFGYYFETKDGERPYADVTDVKAAGLEIATVDALFEEFYESHPDLMFIVEIKDGGERGIEACRVLWETLEKYPEYLDNIVIGTFNPEIEEELKASYPELLRGAATASAAKFVVTEIVGLNLFDNGDFACLQIPMSYDLGIELNLDKAKYIDQAHRRNVAVQYWTINDADEMRLLIELGCDAIMTDDPELLNKVLEEYK